VCGWLLMPTRLLAFDWHHARETKQAPRWTTARACRANAIFPKPMLKMQNAVDRMIRGRWGNELCFRIARGFISTPIFEGASVLQTNE